MAQPEKVPQQIPVVGSAVLVRCPDNNDGGPPKTYLINYLAGSTMPSQKPGTPEEKTWKKAVERKKTQLKRKDERNIISKSNATSAQNPAPQSSVISSTSTTSTGVAQPSAMNVSTAKMGPPSRMVTRSRGTKIVANTIENPVKLPSDNRLSGSTEQTQQKPVDNPVLVHATRMQTRKGKSDVTDTQSNVEHTRKTINNHPINASKTRKSTPGQKSNASKDDVNATNSKLNITDTKPISEQSSNCVSIKPTSGMVKHQLNSKSNSDRDDMYTTYSKQDDQTDLHNQETDGSPAKRQKTPYRAIKPYLKIEDVVKAMTKVPVQDAADSQETDINNIIGTPMEEHLGVEATTDVNRKETIKDHGGAVVTQTNAKHRSQKVIRLPLLTQANLELEDILIEMEIEKGLFVGSLEQETLKNGNSKFHIRVSNETFKDAIKLCNDITENSEKCYFTMKSGKAHPSLNEDQRKELEISCPAEHETLEKTAEKPVENEEGVEYVAELEMSAQQHTSDRSEEAPGESVISDIGNTSAAVTVADDTTSVAIEDIPMEGDVNTSVNEGKTVEGLKISSDNLASILSTDTKDPTFFAPRKHLRGVLEEDLKDTNEKLKTRKRNYVRLDKPQIDFDYKVKLDKNGKRVYICNICGHEAKGNMSSHFRMHKGERPYQCSVCGKAFNNKSNFNKHKLTHSSERPFSCSVCGYTFKCRTHLRVHAERHFTTGKHMCQFCGKCFHTPRELEAHAQMHDKKPKFECSVCKKKFQHTHALRRHEKTHASTELHRCHLCGATFSRSDNYRVHLKKKHKDKLLSDEVCQSVTPAWKQDVKPNTQPEREPQNLVIRIEMNGSEAEYQAEEEYQPMEDEVSEVKNEGTGGSEEVQIVYMDGVSEIPHVVQEVEVELATHELATLLAGFSTPTV